MQYTVHRALSMLKTTKARIEKELSSNYSFIRVARGQEDNIRGVAVSDIERYIQGSYDRITALINNYTKIKSAVIRSNAGIQFDAENIRKVPIMGLSLTVAEIIDMSDVVYGKAKSGNGNKPKGFKAALLAKLKQDYAEAQSEFDDLQEKADDEVRQYLNALSVKRTDNDEVDASAKATIEATSRMLHEQKDPRFIDPLKIADKIMALENEIENFRTEADAVLSEQNALTMVEIDLTEIK